MSHPEAGRAAAASAAAVRTVTARTVEVRDFGQLLPHLPSATGVAWIHDGDGMIAWGEAARLELSGPDQFERAADWW